MSELAHLPRGLLSLEHWDALDLDRTRRWELSEGMAGANKPWNRYGLSAKSRYIVVGE